MTDQEKKALRENMDPDLLLEAFEKFNVTSKLMEKAYNDLQQKVEQLNLELEKKNEELSLQLQATELARNQLSDVLGSLHIAVVVLDGDGKVARLNSAAENLFAVSGEESVGKPLPDLFAGKFSDLTGLSALLAREGLLPETEIGDLDAPEPCVLRMSTHPMRGMHGQGEGRIVLVEDVTDIAMRRRDTARTDRLAAMGEMAVQIVHEIRNPMGSIELFASMLKRDLADQPEHAELAHKVQDGIKGLNHVIGNLLNFAKGADPAPEQVDLDDLIKRTLSDLSHQIERQRIEVESALAPEALFVRVDPELWRQVMLNLLLNAVQAMPEGGRLTVASRREQNGGGQDRFLFSVSDTGMGMPADVRERVFHPFFTTKERGTGLGLALVHNIVKAHGGLISVDSATGQGTTFTISLPL